jgi:hypothetical protein
MTELDRLQNYAGTLFSQLKATLIEIEALGKRPIVITHPNGMLDTMRIDPAHATTPAIDAIRASKVHGEQHKCA